eukprot:CAMPEP_0198115046 /NCGR_PEP_ID=MMETSP1442-20131203/6257_1 /TAXON_ID= /ORGANISM="Craspedostauros australis, Strain CCMP3328" /LENGTH=67 /DNA_ID=CAMNT_0043772473 /DNA_START=372 /DNA_END=573 /DNA_ORIENTATION=+
MTPLRSEGRALPPPRAWDGALSTMAVARAAMALRRDGIRPLVRLVVGSYWISTVTSALPSRGRTTTS